MGEIRNQEDLGTSPRMRGKRLDWCEQVSSFGNIPAHAGKTPYCSPQTQRHQEHPRACGENEDSGFF